MSIEAFEKGSNELIGTYFSVREFDCKCSRPECDYTLIDPELISRLDKLRKIVGHPVQITSGYRCEAHQADLTKSGYKTATGRSSHCDGRAADIRVRHFDSATLELHARDAGFESIGIAHTFIHVDIRKGYRRWSY